MVDISKKQFILVKESVSTFDRRHGATVQHREDRAGTGSWVLSKKKTLGVFSKQINLIYEEFIDSSQQVCH